MLTVLLAIILRLIIAKVKTKKHIAVLVIKNGK